MIIPDWPAPANIVAGTTTIGTCADALPEGIRWLNQVHGCRVVAVGDLRASKEPLDADAVTGNSAGDVCAVRTADCVPVLLCARDGSEIAAAHAGWRGLVAGVLENTVAALDAAPAELLAWLGPAISQPNFEVGEEVRVAFLDADAGAAACFVPNTHGRWQADLYALAARRLAGCGVTAVFGARWCTFADPRRFHSYRRDPDCGRMVSFAGLK
ncbi:MAG: peptidoglycan editing factor PgeF [Gammaproteobacteria bacterium]|nr:peptidoglycan editing factor PgeF [Gammaproteobacteria bacterium]